MIMSLEAAIRELAEAIRLLATPHTTPTAPESTPKPIEDVEQGIVEEIHVMLMDDAGVPSKFKSRCGICGELGRNSRTCKPDAIDGSHHWIEVDL